MDINGQVKNNSDGPAGGGGEGGGFQVTSIAVKNKAQNTGFVTYKRNSPNVFFSDFLVQNTLTSTCQGSVVTNVQCQLVSVA